MSLKFANSANFHILVPDHRKIAIAAAAIAAVVALDCYEQMNTASKEIDATRKKSREKAKRLAVA